MRHNLRNMRKMRIIDALFPKVRQQILSTLLLDPQRAWFLSDLAKHHGTSPSSLQRALASLVAAGILSKTRDGNRAYFKADETCPVHLELRGLLLKTAGLVDQVGDALSKLSGRIRIAFIYGSIASSAERSSSDVDLLIIGELRLPELSIALRPLECQLTRAVNPTLYSQTEFRDKLRTGNNFLTSVMEGPKLFIIGSEHELAAIAECGAGEAAHDEQEGTGRPSGDRRARPSGRRP